MSTPTYTPWTPASGLPGRPDTWGLWRVVRSSLTGEGMEELETRDGRRRRLFHSLAAAQLVADELNQLGARRLAAGLPADEPLYLTNTCPVCGLPMLGSHYHEGGKV